MKKLPKSVKLMLRKFNGRPAPHERKKLEVACVVHATSKREAIFYLQDLIHQLNEDASGSVGSGVGYGGSITYAITRT